MEKKKLQVILGEGSFFDGEFRFFGESRIAGHVKGRIQGKGTLIVEATAKIEADLEIDHLILYGECSGNVHALKSVTMHPPAQFFGQVFTPSLSIKEGVFFEGSSKKFKKFEA